MLKLTLIAILLVSCGPTTPSATGDDTGPDAGIAGVDAPKPLALPGTYRLESHYDLATNMPGTVGVVVNELISATDDPDDPTRYLVDKLVAALPDGTIKTYASDYADYLTGFLNDQLEDIAPSFVTTIVSVGNKLGQVAKNFGLLETLVIDDHDRAVLTVTGVHFVIDHVDLSFAFSDYDMPEITIGGLAASIDVTGKLVLSDHELALRYGQMLRLAMDKAIVPLVDPAASSLGGLLADLVHCDAVGADLADAIGFGSASTYETACRTGLSAMANLVYAEISHVDDSSLTFTESGIAKGLDENHDGALDTILSGAWSGTLAYGPTATPLTAAPFTGTRQ